MLEWRDAFNLEHSVRLLASQSSVLLQMAVDDLSLSWLRAAVIRIIESNTFKTCVPRQACDRRGVQSVYVHVLSDVASRSVYVVGRVACGGNSLGLASEGGSLFSMPILSMHKAESWSSAVIDGACVALAVVS